MTLFWPDKNKEINYHLAKVFQLVSKKQNMTEILISMVIEFLDAVMCEKVTTDIAALRFAKFLENIRAEFIQMERDAPH